MERTSLNDLVKTKARELGFVLVGVARDVPSAAADFYDWWTEQGFGGEMNYLIRHRQKKRSIQTVLPGAQSAIVCALPFAGNQAAADNGVIEGPYGKIARYAQGQDYHEVLAKKLEALARFVDEHAETRPELASKAYVDSAPVSERALAAAAGIGWVGKNAMLIHPDYGSWFWLGEVVTQIFLEADAPLSDRCGTCRRCVDACPTQAILENVRAVDARRCISYLTIEKRGEIAAEFLPAIGDWLVGCDICQEVCPWNAHSLRHGREEVGEPQVEREPLAALAEMTEAEFKKRFGLRAVARTKLVGLQRNAKIVRGNMES